MKSKTYYYKTVQVGTAELLFYITEDEAAQLPLNGAQYSGTPDYVNKGNVRGGVSSSSSAASQTPTVPQEAAPADGSAVQDATVTSGSDAGNEELNKNPEEGEQQ